MVLLALPAMRGDDKPKDEDKPKTPKEQYQALVKEFGDQRSEFLKELQKLKGKEQQQQIQKYLGLGKEFAPRFFKLAEDNSKDPIATDAVFWVVQNAAGAPVHEKAMAKAISMIGDSPIKDLAKRLSATFIRDEKFLEAVLDRAAKDDKDEAATDLQFWAMMNSYRSEVHYRAVDRVVAKIEAMSTDQLADRVRTLRDDDAKLIQALLSRVEKDEKHSKAEGILISIATIGASTPAGAKAAEKIFDKDPEHSAIERICQALGRGKSAEGAAVLKKIIDKTPDSRQKLKVSATFNLAQNLVGQTDDMGHRLGDVAKVVAEAEKYFTMVIDEYGKDNPALKEQAEKELKAFRFVHVGKDAPIITAPDLDEKEFKLSDYRGKVILLDFWGHW